MDVRWCSDLSYCFGSSIIVQSPSLLLLTRYGWYPCEKRGRLRAAEHVKMEAESRGTYRPGTMGMAVTTGSQGEARRSLSQSHQRRNQPRWRSYFRLLASRMGRQHHPVVWSHWGLVLWLFLLVVWHMKVTENWHGSHRKLIQHIWEGHTCEWKGLVGLPLRPLDQAEMTGRKWSLLFQLHPNTYDSELPTIWAMLWEGFVLSRFSDTCTCLFLFWVLELHGTDLLPINITALTIFEGAHFLCPKSSLLRILGI